MNAREIYEAAEGILNDHCPKNERYQLCRMMEDPDGDCYMCWQNYLWYLRNGMDCYRCDRLHPEGLVG